MGTESTDEGKTFTRMQEIKDYKTGIVILEITVTATGDKHTIAFSSESVALAIRDVLNREFPPNAMIGPDNDG